MKACPAILPRMVICAVLAGTAMPALAHGLILKCVLLDEQTVRCRGGYHEGEGAPGESIEVIDYDNKSLLARKLGKDSTLTFARPKTPYYVKFDVGPGEQAIVEHDEIAKPGPADKARWMRR